MRHQPSSSYAADDEGCGHRLAQLRHVLSLVEEMAGRTGEAPIHPFADDARLGSAYEDAPEIVQKRFDSLAAEIAAWAAAGVQVLLTTGDSPRAPRAAARQLATELRRSLVRLGKLVEH